MRKIILCLGIFLLFVSHSYAEEVSEILKIVREKANQIKSYKADFILRFDSPAGEMLMNGNILFQREDKLKMEIAMPNIPNATQLSVSDGDIMWQYLPYLKIASRVDLAHLKKELGDSYFAYSKEDISKPFKELREDSIRYLGKEKLEEEECFVLEAEPKEGTVKEIPFSRIKVWIDTNSGLEKKTVFYNSENKEVFSRFYKNISTNIPIPDTEFKFSPPQGIEVIDMTEETRRYIETEKKANSSSPPSFTPQESPLLPEQ